MESFRLFDLPLTFFLISLLLRSQCRLSLLVYPPSKERFSSRSPLRTPSMAFLGSNRCVQDQFRAFPTLRLFSVRVPIFTATANSLPSVCPPWQVRSRLEYRRHS